MHEWQCTVGLQNLLPSQQRQQADISSSTREERKRATKKRNASYQRTQRCTAPTCSRREQAALTSKAPHQRSIDWRRIHTAQVHLSHSSGVSNLLRCSVRLDDALARSAVLSTSELTDLLGSTPLRMNLASLLRRARGGVLERWLALE